MDNRIGQKCNNIKCALSLQYYDVQKFLYLKAHYRFEISRTGETWKTLKIALEKVDNESLYPIPYSNRLTHMLRQKQQLYGVVERLGFGATDSNLDPTAVISEIGNLLLPSRDFFIQNSFADWFRTSSPPTFPLLKLP